jgi:hypothetical protein
MSMLGRIGFWAGLAAFAATVGYDVVQILQVAGVLQFPLDEVLIFGTSLCIVVPFVFEMLALHHTSRGEQRFWTQAALVFTTMYAVFGTANYTIQLATVIPAKLRGAGDAVRVLEQTPHSLLWDFDALAYIAMGLALLVIVPTLRNRGVERWARTACLANIVATVLAGVVYFHPTYSTRLLMLGFPWGVTAPLSMVLLALALRARGGRSHAEPPRSSPRDVPRPHPAREG